MTETAGQIDIFEVLAAAEADEQELHVQRYGIPILFASPTRGVAARIAEFETWATTWGRHGSTAANCQWRNVLREYRLHLSIANSRVLI
ncbi:MULTISPECIES: hypothetical protein [unclassified Rhodococcus (in: high G+C Gram-positive bacteria)]|uniref:hypothetical protein n=1 Tax=unclassified Rhodococcus (in: high G+C Gram-positive bacteria) TaxID=192944 RepID=UPI000485A42A|nr:MULTISPECIES: hypothetical protein [unclassified Rhodococcus (in: high G+C Gram-positive bacteria)]MCJ0894398.1 hypothetical protein [Rhodococcus sp. ARC_M5]